MTKSTDREVVRGWHFVGERLRGGSPIPRTGAWLKIPPQIKIACCPKPARGEGGLHGSRKPHQALQYAPGDTKYLCYVEVRGDFAEQADKFVARERRIIARMDCVEMLRYYARMQAVKVVHLWDAPDVVLDYLLTGDEALRRDASAASASAASAYAEFASASASAASASAAYAAYAEFDELVYECFEGVIDHAK